MKKSIYLLMLFAGNVVVAQDNNAQPAPGTQPVGTATVQPAQTPYPNAPEITFTEIEHNFGTLKKGEPVTYKFKYKNTGKENLIISTCKAGCDCTTAKCSKEPLSPGKTGFIEVHYDSMRVGKFGKEVMIHSNARKPVVLLVIRGNIEDPALPVNNEQNIKSPAEKHAE